MMMPLRLKRSRAGIILLTVCFSFGAGLMVYVGRPVTLIASGGGPVEMGGWSAGLFVRVGVALLLAAYCAKRIADGRHVVEIDEHGILDRAARPSRIAWSEIAELSCEAVGDAGALVLALRGPEPKTVRVNLDGIDAPLQTVFSSAQEYWQSSRERGGGAEPGR